MFVVPDDIASNGDWNAWCKYVLLELRRIADTQENLEKRLNAIDVQVGGLNIKSGVWGAIAGTIPVCILIIYRLLEH